LTRESQSVSAEAAIRCNTNWLTELSHFNHRGNSHIFITLQRL
jgi:hypothetical protein